MIFKHYSCGYQVKFQQKLKYTLCNKIIEEDLYYCKNCKQIVNKSQIIENRR